MSATKTARKGHSSFGSYDDLIKHTEKPLASRRELAIGRGGAHVKPRKFHLSADEVADLKAQYKETGKFPNPHNRGFYFFLVQALADMGLNDKHPQGRVMQKVESLMSADDTIQGEGRDTTTAWDRFVNKDPRNDNGKDYDARFDQNVTVLQRLTGLTPYGRKLLDVGTEVLGTEGCVIDVLVADTGTKYLRLNTHSNRPINEAKTRGMGSPAEIAAEKAAKLAKIAKKNGGSKRKAKKAAPAEAEAVTSTPVAETATPATAE